VGDERRAATHIELELVVIRTELRWQRVQRVAPGPPQVEALRRSVLDRDEQAAAGESWRHRVKSRRPIFSDSGQIRDRNLHLAPPALRHLRLLLREPLPCRHQSPPYVLS